VTSRTGWECQNGERIFGYTLGRGITLHELPKKKVQEKVQAIASEFPIYEAVMTKCCVGGNLFSLVRSNTYSFVKLLVWIWLFDL
jgi:hypothetical protein